MKTVHDFMSLPEGIRAELIEGEITVMSPSPVEIHQSAVSRLLLALMTWAEPRGAGKIFVAPFDVHLPSGDIVEPDVIFVSSAKAGIVKEWIYGTPDLLVEVLSPDSLKRDRVVKKALFEKNGVTEYWIVDPAERSLQAFELVENRYRTRPLLFRGEVLCSPLLPGFALPVGRIFSAP